MNISYDAYKVFCAVASLGSITGAAEKLYISRRRSARASGSWRKRSAARCLSVSRRECG